MCGRIPGIADRLAGLLLFEQELDREACFEEFAQLVDQLLDNATAFLIGTLQDFFKAALFEWQMHSGAKQMAAQMLPGGAFNCSALPSGRAGCRVA